MKKRIEPKYKFLGILLLFVIGIIAITAAPVGTKPIPGHNGSQIQPRTILGDRMADNLNLTGNVSIDSLTVNGVTGGVIPSGFCIFSATQTSCPIGWTRSATFDGRTINGSATNIGSTGGSATHTHSLSDYSISSSATLADYSVSSTTGSTAISIAQMPSHAHNLGMWNTRTTNTPGNYAYLKTSDSVGSSETLTTASIGGGEGHTHTMADYSVSSSASLADYQVSSSTNSASSWPPYVNVLICCKD